MGHAFTPGLKVSEKMVFKKERRLPLKGKVIVKVGDKVKAEDVVAKTELPGNVYLVNAANKLSVQANEIHACLLKKEGEHVKAKELIAETKGFFGMLKSTLLSPAEGTIESISPVTGQMIIRGNPIPVLIHAYIDGVVVWTDEDETAIIESPVTFIQGIFGIGGEIVGTLKVVSASPDDVLDVANITPDLKGKIIVGGSHVTAAAVKKAIEVGVKGIIAGGINDKDVREFLGYDIGVAITGTEDIGLTILVTEGFGRIKMADRTYNLLKKREGMKTSINGATQIRAGVMRPEVVIPLGNETMEGLKRHGEGDEETGGILHIGTPVRIIRQPNFGKLAKVSGLPVELQKLETESHARVLEVELETGKRVTLPRANVEIIEQ